MPTGSVRGLEMVVFPCLVATWSPSAQHSLTQSDRSLVFICEFQHFEYFLFHKGGLVCRQGFKKHLQMAFFFFFLTHLSSINSKDCRFLQRKPRSIFPYNRLQRETLEDLFIPREKLQPLCVSVCERSDLSYCKTSKTQPKIFSAVDVRLPSTYNLPFALNASVSRGKRRSQRNTLISIVLHLCFRIKQCPPTLTNFLFVSRNKSSSNPLLQPTHPHSPLPPPVWL